MATIMKTTSTSTSRLEVALLTSFLFDRHLSQKGLAMMVAIRKVEYAFLDLLSTHCGFLKAMESLLYKENFLKFLNSDTAGLKGGDHQTNDQ
jgi:hypothetical protein